MRAGADEIDWNKESAMLKTDAHPVVAGDTPVVSEPAPKPNAKNSPRVSRYARRTPEFGDALGASAARVICAMDKAGDDIPYQRPDIEIALPSVGLDRNGVPVRLADPLGSSTLAIAFCDVAVRTSVPSSRRGIHTSRIGNAIAESATRVYSDLQSYALDLARHIDDAEYGGRTEVKVDGAFSYLEPVSGWRAGKNKSSLEHLALHASVRLDSGKPTMSAGLSINHITACPCVQQTYKHALLEAKGDVHQALVVAGPLLTHSQRCRTRVELRGLHATLPIRELLEALDASVYRVQNTLPREHELLLVYRAHREPQFIEDAMRQVVAAVGKTFASKFPQATVRVDSVSFESIHDYDIRADIELPMRALLHTSEAA